MTFNESVRDINESRKWGAVAVLQYNTGVSDRALSKNYLSRNYNLGPNSSRLKNLPLRIVHVGVGRYTQL